MSTSNDKITLYNAVVCPYAQRAAIALKEVGVEYENVDIDLSNKPAWYKDINPETKVPALGVEGTNIAESLVIIEYINDRFPEANLLPKEAIKRAHIRFAIEHFGSKVNASFFKYVFNHTAENARETFEKDVNAALARFDELLKQQSATGPYFLGEEYSLADVAIAPFLLRINAYNQHILDGFKFEAVEKSPRFKSFIEGATSRPTVQETYIGDEKYAQLLKERFNIKKD